MTRKNKMDREDHVETMLKLMFYMDHVEAMDYLMWYTQTYKAKFTIKDNGQWHDQLIFEDDGE